MDLIHPNGVIGTAPARVDGLAKVTGRALYGADHTIPDAAHAYLVTSPIAVGRIRSIDCSAARAMFGVCDVLTYKEVGRTVKAGKPMLDGGYMSHAVAPLGSDRIHFSGQITAVVVANTFEIA